MTFPYSEHYGLARRRNHKRFLKKRERAELGVPRTGHGKARGTQTSRVRRVRGGDWSSLSTTAVSLSVNDL